MKRTKIVATLGPATSEKTILKEMVLAGVDVFRLNFSHGSYDDHKALVKVIREINKEMEMNVAILADLQGPKLRIGEMSNGGVTLEKDQKIIITTKECVGDNSKIYITYPSFTKDVKKGEKILMDDGKIILEAEEVINKTDVRARVIHPGVLKSKKGINLPNTKISLPSLTEKDLKDLNFVIENKVDWIGLSFVRTARDIIELKHLISNKKSNAKVIAKIEKPEAIEDIEDILKATDGIMVARGDLGVEIPMQNVPLIQKMLIKKSRSHSKPVIVATQMMESMIENISPTRAEVNDVANAVLDGADALMLSGETSVGKFPTAVIKNMSDIIGEIEKSEEIYHKEEVPEENQERFISDSICFNAVRLAKRVNSKAIVTMTFSGYTAYKISSQRPKCPTFVFTGNKQILTQLNLVWGVKGFYYDKMVSTDHTIADIKYLLKKMGYVHKDDLVINIASIPIEEKGKSNMLKLSAVE